MAEQAKSNNFHCGWPDITSQNMNSQNMFESPKSWCQTTSGWTSLLVVPRRCWHSCQKTIQNTTALSMLYHYHYMTSWRCENLLLMYTMVLLVSNSLLRLPRWDHDFFHSPFISWSYQPESEPVRWLCAERCWKCGDLHRDLTSIVAKSVGKNKSTVLHD